MSSQFSLSERVLTAERDHQHIFANSLKRKLEAVGRNGFAPTEDREMSAQEHELYSLTSEKSKRQRFSDNFTHDYHTDRQEMCTNGESNHFSTVDNGDSCPSIGYNGNSIGADSSLQNNLEYNVSNENEETAGMDFECETVINTNSPPNLNVVTDDVIECDSAESSPAKGSPAREFLLKHRPECQMHCIPSYCHPGGLWDVMLEVYHGL